MEATNLQSSCEFWIGLAQSLQNPDGASMIHTILLKDSVSGRDGRRSGVTDHIHAYMRHVRQEDIPNPVDIQPAFLLPLLQRAQEGLPEKSV